MTMNNFREMPFVRALLVALVVVVCFGVLGTGEAFAKYEMQNGHEGDPDDGMDVVGGGGGEGYSGDDSGDFVVIFIEIKWVSFEGQFYPVFYFDSEGIELFSVSNFSKSSELKWRRK